MQLTVGQIIGKALKAYGVPYVTGLPGHGNWSMIDAFNDPVSKLRFIQVMHEQSAVHIADAHYRVTGQPIAACTSIGPGATNTIIGLATAYCDSTALLLITVRGTRTAIQRRFSLSPVALPPTCVATASCRSSTASPRLIFRISWHRLLSAASM